MINKKPIGIFDSGVGGLTVLKEIEKILPNENLIYFGDNLRSPYGSKTHSEIIDFSLQIGEFLENLDVKLVVIACNTATIISLNALQKKLKIPIIGVISPGVYQAIKLTKNRKIGVLSTPNTAKTNAYQTEIKKIDSEIDVFQVGCEPLCQLIEDGWEDKEENQKLIKYYVDKLPKDVDVVIFGCTHYPIIREHFEKELNCINIVDPAEKTALEVKNLLDDLQLLSNKNSSKDTQFYTSGNRDKFKKIAGKILNRNIPIVKHALNKIKY